MTTNRIVLSQRVRRQFVEDGIRMGYKPRQLAEYLEVSESTVRRDLRSLSAWPLADSDTWPDAYRGRPGDHGALR